MLRNYPGIKKFVESVATAFVAGLASVLLAKYQDRIFPALSLVMGLYGIQAGIALGVLGGGLLAYWFKRLNQWWYGVVEIIFGFAAAANISFRMAPGKPLFAQWATLVACAYVIARGRSNCAESRAKERDQ